MSHVFDELAHVYAKQFTWEHSPWLGFFAYDVAEFNKGAYINIPEFTNGPTDVTEDAHVWGPCRWQSRDATSLPRAGDECLIMFDQFNQPWIIAWWPSDFERP